MPVRHVAISSPEALQNVPVAQVLARSTPLCMPRMAHLVHSPPAPFASEAEDPTLVYDLQGVAEVFFEEEVEAAQGQGLS
jgi:hypothetical protein